MTDFAKLSLSVDASGMVPGEQALDQLARTGARVEGSIKLNTKGIERSMAALGNSLGGLGGTMKSLEAALTRSLGGAAQAGQTAARTFDDLRRSIDPAFAASERFAEVQRELAAFVASGAAEQAQANQILEIARSRYLGVATAAEAAEQAQREQAQAVAQATANYQALRASLDPLYVASKRYESAVEAADAALKAKIITEAEHARVLQMAETRYLALAPATAAATGGLSKFTPVITNASFQVQDFAVQVASGQSALIAFAQQFPQLAGAFGFSGTLALVGAGLGTLVAVGAAVAPMLLTMGQEARTTEEAIEDLAGSLADYSDAVSNALMPMDELWKKFGQGAIAARETYAAMAQIARIQYFQEMRATIASLAGDLQGITKAVQDWQAATQLPDFMREEAIAGASTAAQALANSFGLSVVEANRVSNAIESLKTASAAGPREAAAASRALGDELMRAYEASDRTNVSLLNSAKEAYQFSISAQEAANALGDADTAAAGATTSTQNWAMAMAGVRAEILGIVSALSQIGGGMISNAAKFVEINALKAGKSVAEARVELEKFNVAAKYDGEIMAAQARGPLGWVEAQALRAAKAMELSGIAAATEADALRKSAAEAERAATKKGKGTSDAEKAAKKAARESERLAEKLDKEAEKWRANLSPMGKYQQEMAELAKLTGRLSQGEMAEAQRKLNVELMDSVPLAGEFVDTLSEGLLNGFSGTLSSMGDMLKQWLANAIAMAAKNRIVMSMGMAGNAGGIAGQAAAGLPGMGGAGGVLGGLSGGLGALGGGILSGASGFLSAASGGLGSAATYTSFMLKGATSGLAGLGSALGAVALPIAAVVAAFSFFKKKTKELDAGIRVTVDGLDTLVQEFRKTETRRFWGLSKKVRTRYEDADAETQDALSKIVGTLQAGIMDAAEVLGFGSATFAKFAAEMKVSTKGMSEEEALAAVQEAIAGLGDDFAGMVPGLKRLRQDGEGASDALLRLSQSLVTVNGIADTLGHAFKAAGLSGADTASKIAAAFGGLDAMASATQRYYEAFYSDAERLATTTRQTAKAMSDLGIAMPKTRNEYRAIIAALDLTTEKGRKTYAAMIGMADAFDLILPKMAGFTAEMERLQGKVETALGSVMEGLADAIKLNAAAAADWRKAGEGIREYLERLRGTASALISPQQALANNRAVFNRTLARANAGNVEAAQALPGAAQAYLASATDTARTREEAAMAQARVAAALGKVAVKTDTTATALEEIAALQQKQLDLLQGVKDQLARGEALTKEGITSLLGKLGGLDDRIALRAGDAGTIVAGVGAAVKGAKVAANVTATLTGADGLQSAMGTLRTALGDLRAAIAAETKRQQDAVKKAADVVKAPVKPVTPATPAPATPAPPKAYTAADYQFRQTFINTSGGREPAGISVTGPLGGVRRIGGTGTSIAEAQRMLAAAKFPAFATGGLHKGGLRIVGENGPELEATGPSRIISNSQTRDLLGNREMLAELKALRAELAELKAHARRGTDASVQTEKTLKRIDALGVKIDPDQNKVTA